MATRVVSVLRATAVSAGGVAVLVVLLVFMHQPHSTSLLYARRAGVDSASGLVADATASSPARTIQKQGRLQILSEALPPGVPAGLHPGQGPVRPFPFFTIDPHAGF